MRRALIAVLTQSQGLPLHTTLLRQLTQAGNLERILERTLTTFSDKLQIQHAATTLQERE